MAAAAASTESSNAGLAAHPIREYIQLLNQPNTSPSYARTIILKALSDPNIHAGFSEISALPTVQGALADASASTTGQSLLKTLDLFSYGSYLDYTSAPEGTFISLNEAQLKKLKALTIVVVVQQTCESTSRFSPNNNNAGGRSVQSNTVPQRRNRRSRVSDSGSSNHNHSNNETCGIVQYSTLQVALGIDSTTATQENKNENQQTRQLEDLLIYCIYSNLLPPGTKLDQKNMLLLVKLTPNLSESNHHILCRDVNLERDVPDMISKLEAFYQQANGTKVRLEKCLGGLNVGSVEDNEKWKQVEEAMKRSKEAGTEQVRRGKSGSSMDMEMGGSGGAGFLSNWGSLGGRNKRQTKKSRPGGYSK